MLGVFSNFPWCGIFEKEDEEVGWRMANIENAEKVSRIGNGTIHFPTFKRDCTIHFPITFKLGTAHYTSPCLNGNCTIHFPTFKRYIFVHLDFVLHHHCGFLYFVHIALQLILYQKYWSQTLRNTPSCSGKYKIWEIIHEEQLSGFSFHNRFWSKVNQK